MPEDEQDTLLDVLIETNLCGVDTHGIHLLRFYFQKYTCYPRGQLRSSKTTKRPA
jgi:LDH2 family malate/lactate/ureidoglycolate dehydrogenase